MEVMSWKIEYCFTPTAIVKFTALTTTVRHRAHLSGALEMPERLAGKLARAVLRGLGDSNVSWLPDR